MPDLTGGAPLFGLISAIIAALVGVWIAIIKFRESTAVAQANTKVSDSENIRNQLWKTIDKLELSVKDLTTEKKTLEGEVAALKIAIAADEIDDKLNAVQSQIWEKQLSDKFRKLEEERGKLALESARTIAELHREVTMLIMFIESHGLEPPTLQPAPKGR